MKLSMVLKRGCCQLLNLTSPSLRPWSPALFTTEGEDEKSEKGLRERGMTNPWRSSHLLPFRASITDITNQLQHSPWGSRVVLASVSASITY